MYVNNYINILYLKKNMIISIEVKNNLINSKTIFVLKMFSKLDIKENMLTAIH